MRKWIWVALAASAILAAVPVVKGTWEGARGWAENWKRRQEEKAFMSLPPQLPIRPGDYRRFPREGFGFVIDAGPGYRIDSFQGTMTREVRSGRDTTIALRFTPAEMDSIYREMIAVRISDLEEPHPPFVEGPAFFPHDPNPDTTRVEVRAGAALKHFTWFVRGRIVRRPDHWKRLSNWVYLITQIAERKPAYRALSLPHPYL